MEEFSNQILNLRSAENGDKQKKVAEELPALWPNLLNIIFIEKTNFLPGDVAEIVKKLIVIRRTTFLTAAARSPDEYIEWEDKEEENSTMFYPNWPI